ncbi:MAG: SPOR domain-containing protein [Legionellaceae bacterium]
MKIFLQLFTFLCLSHLAYADVIYGVDQIQHRAASVHYPAYVQVGSFSSIHAAQRVQEQMKASPHVRAMIQSSGGRHKVVVGPFRNSSSLKAFAVNMAKHQRQPYAPKLSSMNFLSFPSTDMTFQPGSHPEVSVFLGGAYIPNTINGQKLQLLPYETGPYADTFTHQSSGSAFTWGVDALYRFKLHAPSTEPYFFDALGAGLDVFQITHFNQTGKVLQFNEPVFENYTYTLKLNTVRVMANVDLDFQPIQSWFIPFVQAGLGGASTTVSYTSVPISPVDSPNFTLPNESSWHFAYQAGAGLKYVVKPRVILSLRYLYANMGQVNSSTLGSTTTLATPLTVTMSTQNFLFGLTYSID